MQNKTVAGIDVGKTASHAFAAGESGRFANEGSGFRNLRNWLRRRQVDRVVMEPTCRFHRRAHQSVVDGGFEVVLANPLRTRGFAEAKGDLAKTDRVDATMLAAIGEAFRELPPSDVRGGFQEGLEVMLVSRESLVEHRTSLRQTAEDVGGKEQKPLERIAGTIDREIPKLDAAIEAHIRSDEDFTKRYDILRSMPGIGPATAAMLYCWIPELGFNGDRQAASRLGVAPFSKDSGKRQGECHIPGGRRRPRDAMYMAAHAVARHNPDLAALRERLKAQGRKHKVAIVAVKRKLFVLANALLRDGRHWSPNAPESAIATRG